MREYSTPRFAVDFAGWVAGAADFASLGMPAIAASEAPTEHLTAWEILGNGGSPGTLALTFTSFTRSKGAELRGEVLRTLGEFRLAIHAPEQAQV